MSVENKSHLGGFIRQPDEDFVYVTHAGLAFLTEGEVQNWSRLSRNERDMAYELMTKVIEDENNSQ